MGIREIASGLAGNDAHPWGSQPCPWQAAYWAQHAFIYTNVQGSASCSISSTTAAAWYSPRNIFTTCEMIRSDLRLWSYAHIPPTPIQWCVGVSAGLVKIVRLGNDRSVAQIALTTETERRVSKKTMGLWLTIQVLCLKIKGKYKNTDNSKILSPYDELVWRWWVNYSALSESLSLGISLTIWRLSVYSYYLYLTELKNEINVIYTVLSGYM